MPMPMPTPMPDVLPMPMPMPMTPQRAPDIVQTVEVEVGSRVVPVGGKYEGQAGTIVVVSPTKKSVKIRFAESGVVSGYVPCASLGLCEDGTIAAPMADVPAIAPSSTTNHS